MKKYFLILIIAVLSLNLFADGNQVKEKKPFPKYMYTGEKIDLSDYFKLNDIYRVTLRTHIDNNFYPKPKTETTTDTDHKKTDAQKSENIADNTEQIRFVNDYFNILKLSEDRCLTAEKPGNTDFELIFYFDKNNKEECIKTYTVNVIDFDNKEIKNLSKRYNAHKIFIRNIIISFIILLIIIFIILSYIFRNYRLVKKDNTPKRRRHIYNDREDN